MPYHDFKKEPEVARLSRVWRENKGNWLLVTGVIVGLLACVIGYFDLIPNITATSTNNKPSPPGFMATGTTLVVHIAGCESDQGQVVAMLYSGVSFDESSTAMRVELLKIHNREAVWAIHNLPLGPYAIVAFHDVNSDDVLQAGIERQGPIGRSGKGPTDKPLTYSDLVFQFDQDRQEVRIELR